MDERGPAKRAVLPPRGAAAPGRTIRVTARVTLTLGLTAAVVAVLIRQIGGSALSAAVRGARPGWVVTSFALSGLCVLLGAVRWKMVLRAMGHELGLGRILVVLLATWPPGVVMPSRANELLRAVAVREVVPLAAGTGSILAEKLIDLFVLLAFAGVGAAAQALWPWLAIIGLALVLQVGLTALLARRRGWLSRLPVLRTRPGAVEGLFAAFDALLRSPVRLGSVALVSLGIRVLTVGVGQALIVAVGAEVSVFDTLTLWPVAILVGVLPATLGGMGTRDAAFLYLLRLRGTHATGATILAATLAYSVVSMWSFAILGLPFMLREALARRSA